MTRIKRETYIEIEDFWAQNIIVDHFAVESRNILGDILQKLVELGSANTIGAVDNELTSNLTTTKGPDKRLRHLLVVTDLADLAVRLGSTLGIDASGKVVKLRGCEDLVVGEFGAGSLECIGERSNELVARGTSIAAVDDTAGSVQIDLELLSQTLEGIEEVLVGGAVDELSCVGFPILFQHLAHRVDNLDSIVLSRVVAGGHHDTDGLATKLAAA